MSEEQEKQLISHINNELNDATDQLNMLIQSRLTQARSQAVANIHCSSSMRYFGHLPQGIAVIALAMASVMLSFGNGQMREPLQISQPEPLEFIEVSDIDVLLSNEDLDLLENLDIYEWLADEYHQA